MFHFDNSFNYPVKIIQDDPIVYTVTEKSIQSTYLSTPENMRNSQDTYSFISNPSIASLVPFDSSHKEHKSKQLTSSYPTKANKSNLKRKQFVTKAERRAEHNAIERARRECLNSKFQKLAGVLPNLSSHRRPSKGQIVEKALDWVKQNIARENRYQYQIMQLQNENKRLIDQITATQEKKSSDSANSPVCISADYTESPRYNLQQPFESCNAIPTSPISSNGSNVTTGNAADDQISISNVQIKDTIIENELALSIATDEEDSDIKSIDENCHNLIKTNHCFFEYQNLGIPTTNNTHYVYQKYNAKQIVIEPEQIGYASSFFERF